MQHSVREHAAGRRAADHQGSMEGTAIQHSAAHLTRAVATRPSAARNRLLDACPQCNCISCFFSGVGSARTHSTPRHATQRHPSLQLGAPRSTGTCHGGARSVSLKSLSLPVSARYHPPNSLGATACGLKQDQQSAGSPHASSAVASSVLTPQEHRRLHLALSRGARPPEHAQAVSVFFPNAYVFDWRPRHARMRARQATGLRACRVGAGQERSRR